MKPVLVAVALVWIGFGVHGAFSYGDSYLSYRGFPPPKDPVGVSPGRLVHERFYSPAMHSRRSYYVYEPPGYAQDAARGRRFPVLYLLHGAPGTPTQFLNISGAGVKLDEGVQRHTLRPFLLAMPDGSDGHFRNEHEWANTPHGNFESLVMEVVRSVDQRFATRRGRRFRGLGGNSEGGYAAVNLALRHPRVFSLAEAWSGYFWQTRRGVFAKVPPARFYANDPEAYLPALGTQFHRFPLHAYIYRGRHERANKLRVAAFVYQLRLQGADVTYKVFHGGHDWRLWRIETARMLAYANHWFSAPRKHHRRR